MIHMRYRHSSRIESAHQIRRKRIHASAKSEAGAKEAVRLPDLSEPEVRGGRLRKTWWQTLNRSWSTEAIGQLAALFPPEPGRKRLSASSRNRTWCTPGTSYIGRQPSADAISMHGYAGSTRFNFTDTAMLAVTIKEGLFGVAARGLQWNVQLALVWTRVEVHRTR